MPFPRMFRMAVAALPALAAAGMGPACAETLDKVTFGTNWVAEAEHGGFYQALADGTYRKYGLDVTIVPGGPNANNRMLMTVGKLDFSGWASGPTRTWREGRRQPGAGSAHPPSRPR